MIISFIQRWPFNTSTTGSFIFNFFSIIIIIHSSLYDARGVRKSLVNHKARLESVVNLMASLNFHADNFALQNGDFSPLRIFREKRFYNGRGGGWGGGENLTN